LYNSSKHDRRRSSRSNSGLLCSSHIALVGGGTKLRPGEISLAHRGVLFLDEFPEFGRESIEALRQPLEDGHVVISRASGSIEYPSKFYLLAAANPTPSGFDPDDPDALKTPQNRNAINRYQAKFSGPILDRIDLQVEVNRPQKSELQSKDLAETSFEIRKRVQKARDIQTKRFQGTKIFTNSEMSLPLIQKYCILDSNTEKLLSQAIDKYKLSARGYMRLLKLSRTIADLEGSENIELKHLAESLQYRGRWV
jgi:magnesium chelatase family protein